MHNLKTIQSNAKRIGLDRGLWNGFVNPFRKKETNENVDLSVLNSNIAHLHSEVSELYKACINKDIVNAKEEIIDVLFITLGIAGMLEIEISDEDINEIIVKNDKRIEKLKAKIKK